jgi:hypothetical protein
MKLYTKIYNSPLDNEDTFSEVFIEDRSFSIDRYEKKLTVSFEMYRFKNERKISLDIHNMSFYGMNDDEDNSNRTSLISIPNINYDSEVAAVPTKISVTNPNYNIEVAAVPTSIANPDYDEHRPSTILNPDYDALVAAVPLTFIINNPNHKALVAAIPSKILVNNTDRDLLISNIPVEIDNPFYDANDEESDAKIPNPDYDTLVDAIPFTVEIPNPDYDALVDAIPLTVEIENLKYDIEVNSIPLYIPDPEYILYSPFIANPDYDEQVASIPNLIEIDNPDYDAEVEAVKRRVTISMLDYLHENEGVMPEDFEVIDWGYPTYEDAIGYFSGGTIESPELFLTNTFAQQWCLVNIIMKNKSISDGNSFEFIS